MRLITAILQENDPTCLQKRLLRQDRVLNKTIDDCTIEAIDFSAYCARTSKYTY